MLFFEHGHTHGGNGMFNFFGVPVLNPGSISSTGTFLEIELEKESEWKMKRVSFMQL